MAWEMESLLLATFSFLPTCFGKVPMLLTCRSNTWRLVSKTQIPERRSGLVVLAFIEKWSSTFAYARLPWTLKRGMANLSAVHPSSYSNICCCFFLSNGGETRLKWHIRLTRETRDYWQDYAVNNRINRTVRKIHLINNNKGICRPRGKTCSRLKIAKSL